VQLTDAGNAATPPPAAPIALGTSTITVYGAFTASFNQSGNTIPASTLLPGVNLRNYGTISLGAGAPTWSAAVGLGSGTAGVNNYKWCVSAGSASVTATGLGGISTNCLVPTTGANVTLTSASATTGAAIFSVGATDAGNEAVPSVSIPQGTSTININTDLTVALQLVPASPDPTTTAGIAVVGRTYGALAKTNVVYEVSGGLPAYSIIPSGTLTTATNIVCVSGTTTSTCNSAGAGVTNTGGVNPNLTITATDTANAATPAAPAPATKTDVWTVNPAITYSLLPAPTGGTPNGVIPDAVIGRTYGTPLADLVFSASGGLGNIPGFGLTGTQGGSTTANNILCTPATPQPQVGATATMTCNSTAVSGLVTAPGGPANLSMAFSDAGNSTTPGTPALTDTAGYTNYVLNVNTPLGVALQTAPASPDPTTGAGEAVVGRSYGAPTKTNVVYEVSGGLPAAAPPLYTISSSGTLTTATNIACAAGSTTATCNSGGAGVSNTGGVNPSLTITATDSANATTPAAPAPATKTDVWTVNSAITFSLAPGATGAVPNGAILDGVVGRTYGTPLADLVFTASGGLMNSFGLSGTATGTLPATTNISCVPGVSQAPPPLPAPQVVTVTCNSGGSSVTSVPTGAKALVMTFSDPGNSTTPVGSTSTDSAGYTNYSNSIATALSVALQLVPASPDPTLPAGHAVAGRTYGSPSFPAVPAKANVVYEVSGGLPGYTITPSPTSTLLTDTNIACAVGATTVTCNSGGAGVSNTGGVNPSLTIDATDSANLSTPAAPVPATKTDVWTVTPAITFSLAPGAIGVVPNGAIPDGVVGRQYGKPLGVSNLVFAGSGGLGNSATFGLTGTATGTFVTDSGLICAPATPQVGATATVTCNSGGGVSTLGGTATGKTLVMTFSDAGNSTTPVGTSNTDSDGYINYSNTMAAALGIALQTVPLSPDPANVNAQAVVGRTYGAAPEAPVVYEASGGLPGYSFTFSGTLLANSNICLVPVVTATTRACNSGGVGVSGTSGSLTVTALDTANATTPQGSAPLVKTYTVNPAVTMSVTHDPADTTPGTGTVAVIGRGYGTLAVPAMLSPTYTAIDGLGLYTYTLSNPPGAGIACTSGVIATSVCSSANVTAAAPVSFDVTVTDDVAGTSLTTAPDLVGVTITRTFTVNPALAISTLTLRNGLVDFTYSPTGGPGEFIATTGGLGGNTWVAPGGGGGGCAPAGALPTSLSLGAATGLLSGVPTVASPSPLDYLFDVCVFDSPNTTTPSGNDTVSYTVNIMDPLAAVAQPGTDSIEGINTKTNLSIGPVALTAGDVPTSVAVTPDGRKVYVTLNGADDVAVIDTITGTASLIGGLGTCTGPQGIAIGLPGGLPTAFVACSNRRIAVIDASTDTFVSSANYGTAGATFYGVAITPDDSLVYVTDASNDEFVVLDAISAVEIFGSPFALPATVTAPHGVIISADGNRVYIAGSSSDRVIVFDTADNTTVIAGPISTGAGSSPESFAVTPSGAHVYVTLTGTDAFAVFDDTLAAPAIIGAPIVMAGSVPFGVTIPPLLVVPATGVRVYIAQFGPDTVAIRDDETVTPFGVNGASPIALTAVSNPIGIAHIPVPR
jgi:YVTN family beta-propeller protein